MFMRIVQLPACVSNMCMRKLFYEKDSFVLGKKMQKLCRNTKGLIYGGKINEEENYGRYFDCGGDADLSD